MTVIAWDGQVLAADSQSVMGGTPYGGARKIRVSKDKERIIAASGCLRTAMALMDWADAFDRSKPWPHVDGENSARLIVLRRDSLLSYSSEMPGPQFYEEHDYKAKVAWGTGADYAIGAMTHGANAVQAVGVATDCDIYCGAPIIAAMFLIRGRGMCADMLTPMEVERWLEGKFQNFA